MVKWDEEKKVFYEIESGQPLDNLKFKQGYEGEDIVGDEDKCEEFEEKDFEKEEKKTDAEGTEGEKPAVVPATKPKTQKEMLEAAKQIDFFGSDDDDEDDDDEDMDL